MKRRQTNKGKTFPAEVLTEAEVRAIIRQCSKRAPTGIRNRALLTVLYRCGLRCEEALSLKPKDIDDTGTIRVLHGKGDKARTVGIDDGALAVLQLWFDVRAARKVGRSATVFCTLKGGKLTGAYVRQLLPRLARKAGIEKRVHAHGFRHTHAAELAAEGKPMNLIQRVLGHTNLSTTSRYIDHIAPTKIIEAMRSRPWSL